MSVSASPASTTVAPAIMATFLGRLALLFMTGAAGDPEKARQAAQLMLAGYDPQTPAELMLAADIISFGLHALGALSQASDPDLSLNRTLRLRGSAVSLSREAHKSQRKLDQLQHARRAGVQQQPAEAPTASAPTVATPAHPTSAAFTPTGSAPPEAAQTAPKIETALALIEAGREAQRTIARDGGGVWSQTLQKRAAAKRMADKLKQNQAHYASQTAHLNTAPPSGQMVQPAA